MQFGAVNARSKTKSSATMLRLAAILPTTPISIRLSPPGMQRGKRSKGKPAGWGGETGCHESPSGSLGLRTESDSEIRNVEVCSTIDPKKGQESDVCPIQIDEPVRGVRRHIPLTLSSLPIATIQCFHGASGNKSPTSRRSNSSVSPRAAAALELQPSRAPAKLR